MYEKEKLIIDAVIPANNLHVRTELNYKKLSLKLKSTIQGGRLGPFSMSQEKVWFFFCCRVASGTSLSWQKFTRLAGPRWVSPALRIRTKNWSNVERVRGGKVCRIYFFCRKNTEVKLAGEDYMGEIYEGYIPGALEELDSDGILPLLQTLTLSLMWNQRL